MYERSHVFFYLLIFIIVTLFVSQKVIFAATTTQEVLNITAVVPTGSGGNDPSDPTPTEINFSGKAYPNSIVVLLQDAQSIGSTTASVDSNFEFTITDITAGTYLFSFYSEDVYGVRSVLVTMSVEVINEAITTISGIFIPPTIETDNNAVDQGKIFFVYGQAVGSGEVVVEISSGTTSSSTIMTINANTNGLYEYYFDTTPLSCGNYTVKAKAILGEIESSYSKMVMFSVGEPPSPEILIGDLNDDGKVDIVDFSIAAFWYKNSPLSEEFSEIEAERLNNDGKIDLVDFSIMAYYWTG